MISLALFYSLEDPYGSSTQERKIFVGCRMERDVFQMLVQEAKRKGYYNEKNSEGVDISRIIREMCSLGLKKRQEDDEDGILSKSGVL